jgi:hypothetical protein
MGVVALNNAITAMRPVLAIHDERYVLMTPLVRSNSLYPLLM